jgi:hypothetical protein
MMDRVYTQSAVPAADVTIYIKRGSFNDDRATAVLLPGKRYIIDLSLDGELRVTRHESEAWDDREAMMPLDIEFWS